MILSADSVKISELDRIERLISDDMIVFEHDDSEGLSNTYGIRYSELTSMMLQQISSQLSLGSISYHDYWEYSRSYHKHGYTHSEIIPYPFTTQILEYQISEDNGVVYGGLGLGDYGDVVQTNRIGDMKLMTVRDDGSHDVDSDSFNGWVYADGSRYSRYDFPSAYEIFKDMEGSDSVSFVVPQIDDFIKGEPRVGITPYRNEGCMCTPSHTHEIPKEQMQPYNQSIRTNIALKVSMDGPTAGSANAMHTGFKNHASNMTDLSIDINESIFDVDSTTSIDNITESQGTPYPKHFEIPMMVYIGKKERNG